MPTEENVGGYSMEEGEIEEDQGSEQEEEDLGERLSMREVHTMFR